VYLFGQAWRMTNLELGGTIPFRSGGLCIFQPSRVAAETGTRPSARFVLNRLPGRSPRPQGFQAPSLVPSRRFPITQDSNPHCRMVAQHGVLDGTTDRRFTHLRWSPSRRRQQLKGSHPCSRTICVRPRGESRAKHQGPRVAFAICGAWPAKAIPHLFRDSVGVAANLF
jgi:hypothetical protein